MAVVTAASDADRWVRDLLLDVVDGLDLDDPDDRAFFRQVVSRKFFYARRDAVVRYARMMGGTVAGNASNAVACRALADAVIAQVRS